MGMGSEGIQWITPEHTHASTHGLPSPPTSQSAGVPCKIAKGVHSEGISLIPRARRKGGKIGISICHGEGSFGYVLYGSGIFVCVACYYLLDDER